MQCLLVIINLYVFGLNASKSYQNNVCSWQGRGVDAKRRPTKGTYGTGAAHVSYDWWGLRGGPREE